MANIRNMDSWVHKEDREGALQKAKDMVKMSVLRAMDEALADDEVPSHPDGPRRGEGWRG